MKIEQKLIKRIKRLKREKSNYLKLLKLLYAEHECGMLPDTAAILEMRYAVEYELRKRDRGK